MGVSRGIGEYTRDPSAAGRVALSERQRLTQCARQAAHWPQAGEANVLMCRKADLN